MIRMAEIELLSPLPGAHGVYDAPYLRSRKIPCQLRSVYSSEFYQALAQGTNLSLVAILSNYREYQGEANCKLDGVQYRIVRTYVRDDLSIELTLERVAGHEL